MSADRRPAWTLGTGRPDMSRGSVLTWLICIFDAVGRKRAVKVFRGPPTSDLGALDEGLSAATCVQVYWDGCLVYAVRPEDDVLAPETEKWVSIIRDDPVTTTADPAEIAELRAALEVAETQDSVCMCPGDLALEFLDEKKKPVEVVRFDFPNTIKWNGWVGRARLTDPQRLVAWLQRRGVTART